MKKVNKNSGYFKRIPCPPKLPDGLREEVEGHGQPPGVAIDTGKEVIIMSGKEQKSLAKAMVDAVDAWYEKDVEKWERSMELLSGVIPAQPYND